MSNIITLSCTVCLYRNYTVEKKKSDLTTRLKANKYCKNCGRHTLHRETK